MIVRDLGRMGYRGAWAVQEDLHAQVAGGAEACLLLVEHDPVITLGRRDGLESHVLASPRQLAAVGIEVVKSDRGGEATFHGPGQVVVYPILRLADYGLSVGGYMRRLQEIVIAALAELGVIARRDPAAIGVWVDPGPAKICALGVRIRRGVSLHGIALNVRTDLRMFELIVPCGVAGGRVTSLQELLGPASPSMSRVKEVLTRHFIEAFGVVCSKR